MLCAVTVLDDWKGLLTHPFDVNEMTGQDAVLVYECQKNLLANENVHGNLKRLRNWLRGQLIYKLPASLT
jgi:hypothetical protein